MYVTRWLVGLSVPRNLRAQLSVSQVTASGLGPGAPQPLFEFPKATLPCLSAWEALGAQSPRPLCFCRKCRPLTALHTCPLLRLGVGPWGRCPQSHLGSLSLRPFQWGQARGERPSIAPFQGVSSRLPDPSGPSAALQSRESEHRTAASNRARPPTLGEFWGSGCPSTPRLPREDSARKTAIAGRRSPRDSPGRTAPAVRPSPTRLPAPTALPAPEHRKPGCRA